MGVGTPLWLRKLKPTLGGRRTPSPNLPAAQAIVEDGMMMTTAFSSLADGLMTGTSRAYDSKYPTVTGEEDLQTASTGMGSFTYHLSGSLTPPRTWTLTEAKRLYTSKAALRLLPPRRFAACLPAKVAQWAQVTTRSTGPIAPNQPVNQVAIGQIILPSSSSSSFTSPIALHVGCAALAQSETFVAWGFADDCLRVSSATPNADFYSNSTKSGLGGVGGGVGGGGVGGGAASSTPECKLTVALDSAGPVSVLALSENGKVMITGSSTQPVVHVWGLHKGLLTRGVGFRVGGMGGGGAGGGGGLGGGGSGAGGASRRRPQQVTRLGTLVSALHAGGITNVVLSARYSVVVSVCSLNRVVLLWDLDRRRLVRQLSVAPTKKLALDSVSDSMTLCIDEMTGAIVLTVGVSIYVYDTNGSPLACLDLSTLPLRESLVGGNKPNYNISTRSLPFAAVIGGGSCVVVAIDVLNSPATLISACSAVGDGCSPLTLLTGHVDGQIRLWVLEYGSGEREAVKEKERSREKGRLTLIQELGYVSSASAGVPSKAPITALTLSQDLRRFYSGDMMGVVCAWDSSSSASNLKSSIYLEGAMPVPRLDG